MVLKSGHAIALNWSTVAVNLYGEVIDTHTGVIVYRQKYYTNKENTSYRKVRIGRTYVPLHRLILNAWAHNPDAATKYLCNHKDGIKSNNVLDNLEWCSYSDNIKHAVEY